jgi:hypothetical protein
MTEQTDQPQEGWQVNLAVQVAHIAAQVSAAMGAADTAKKSELESKLTLARERLEQKGAPPGLIPFIDVMRGLLDGRDMSTEARALPPAYQAVYEQLMDDLKQREGEGTLTVGQVLEEVSSNVTLALKRGTFDQRRHMADTLLIMAEESRRRPDLAGLIDFLTATRILLQGGDPLPVEAQLEGPFRDAWHQILKALRE